MTTVEHWALANGYDYQSVGDEFFDTVPDWYMRKVRGRMPIAADLARLQWALRFLRRLRLGDLDGCRSIGIRAGFAESRPDARLYLRAGALGASEV